MGTKIGMLGTKIVMVSTKIGMVKIVMVSKHWKDIYGGHKDSYGKDSYGEDSYGEDSYGEDSYGEDSYGGHNVFGRAGQTHHSLSVGFNQCLSSDSDEFAFYTCQPSRLHHSTDFYFHLLGIVFVSVS